MSEYENRLQPASLDIFESKYCLRDHEGNALESLDGTYRRVARALASVETTDREKWEERFYHTLCTGGTPAGRIMANAGAGEHKPATSLINCTVSQTVNDSMDDIFDSLHKASLTLKRGSGIGYEFSTLRPAGAFVAGAGASTSGPLSFMDVFDSMCNTVASAGGRRGAQMGTFDVSHPDVYAFIDAKREAGRLRNFNLSLLITDEFMQAVTSGADWPLVFPLHPNSRSMIESEPGKVLWRDMPHLPDNEHFIRAPDGKVACKVYTTVPARELWDKVMRSTYDYAEPGFILIDRVNEQNNNWWCESIRASNPCGEQMLPPNGACLLGSIDLTKFVMRPFREDATFNYKGYNAIVSMFTRMLDNVVEMNGLPLEQQREEILYKRRHGMGFYGLGSALAMLGMRYGSRESCAFTREISRQMALTGWKTALELAKEKGPAPIMSDTFEVTHEMLAQRPEMAADGYKVGDEVPGRILHARYSRYMQKIAEEDPALVDELANVGARFTHHTSIAPTGTIALSFGNNASNGIEPSFAHEYSRNVIREGRKTKERVDVFSKEFLLYKEICDPEATTDSLPAAFVTSSDVTPMEHVRMQAAAQEWVDSSISKTVNVPTGIDYEDFRDLYVQAWKLGLKGCTTFRYNPEAFQGVLVRKEDSASTIYAFTLEDGSVVEARGDEEIEYDGETHSAGNLYDALKEGKYGRF